MSDHSQKTRAVVQWAFLLLNLWIGLQFYLFVRYYEAGGRGWAVSRPPGVEGWLPIASLMNLKLWISTGEFPRLHPAGLVLLLTFSGIALILRKSFCSWLCPVGTVSEALWRLGRALCGVNIALPYSVDLVLRGLKYLLLGLFVYAIGAMSTDAIRHFLEGPYGVVADVKMLNFFRFLSSTAAFVLAALCVASLFIQNFWCRYLCPYGALLGRLSRFSPSRIERNRDHCIDCGKCSKECPSLLPVHRTVVVRSAECTGCLACVAVCPASGALDMKIWGGKVFPAWAWAVFLVVLFAGAVTVARFTGHWDRELPAPVYRELIPKASQFTHP